MNESFWVWMVCGFMSSGGRCTAAVTEPSLLLLLPFHTFFFFCRTLPLVNVSISYDDVEPVEINETNR